MTIRKEMLDEINRVGTISPLLGPYIPPGFIDFRGGVPHDWRGGLFVRIMDDEQERGIKFKALFGNCKEATDAASSVSESLGIPVKVVAPHMAVMECDGIESKIQNEFWCIFFETPY